MKTVLLDIIARLKEAADSNERIFQQDCIRLGVDRRGQPHAHTLLLRETLDLLRQRAWILSGYEIAALQVAVTHYAGRHGAAENHEHLRRILAKARENLEVARGVGPKDDIDPRDVPHAYAPTAQDPDHPMPEEWLPCAVCGVDGNYHA